MATISAEFYQRWRNGRHIAASTPYQRVAIRTGRFDRGYETWEGGNVNATIANTPRSTPWQATWDPDSEYVDLPNVGEVQLRQSLGESNGITVATIQLENITYPAVAGPGGTYHAVKRGYLSPLRGYQPPGIPGLVENGTVVAKNEWFEKLDRNAQITIWQGYGADQAVKVFTGMIDDVDLSSQPDRITITARDFGQMLTDCRVFGYNKEPTIRRVKFIDRNQADKVAKVGYNAQASSEDDSDHLARYVLDKDPNTFWRSQPNGAANVTEWVDIRLPQGRYEDYYLWPEFDGMEIYVSLYARPYKSNDAGVELAPKMDGAAIAEGWVDVGLGDVPGANGGRPYIQHVTGLSARGLYRTLGHTFVVGENSILRVHFRELQRWRNPNVRGATSNYYAGAKRLFANERHQLSDAKKGHWILVDDVADIVKVILRWAGFKEWNIESTGVPLAKPLVIPESDFYIDVIKRVQDVVNYVFFIADPTSDDLSLGVPTFRKTTAVDRRLAPVAHVRDTDLLTGIQAKLTDEPLGYIIRVRGREGKLDEGGRLLGSGTSRRIMFVYRPPWTIKNRLAGQIKHVVHSNPLFKTMEDCKFAAYYIALEEALKSATATIEIPGFPGVELDQHVAVLDVGTGLATRIWIAERSTTFKLGEQTAWSTSLGGALIDVPDVVDMTTVINAASRGGES